MLQVMKKFVVIALSLLLGAQLHAQKIGIKVGANLADARVESEGVSVDTKSKIGFQAGISADFKVAGGFGINTGVEFAQKGTKFDESFFGVEVSSTLNYLIVPVKLAYTFETGSLGIFVEAGPYFGYGLSGKMKGTYMGQTEEEDITFGNTEDDDLKNPDIGLSAGAGIYAGPIRAAINYDPGLSNLSNFDSESIKTGSLILSVAYLFIR
jgi:hypothetical protein